MTLTITEDFARAFECLDKGQNLFLTGKAGTGKSTLIRHFMATHETRRTVVAAPTGVAALNVGGYTLHRLFSFPTTVTPGDVASGRVKPGRFAKTIARLETLIIDEASMVRADLFDSIALALQMYGPKPGKPFGGIQMVLVGDLYQLPPVVTDPEAEYFQTVYRTPYFFSAEKFDLDRFQVVSLETVFRQIGDDALVDILNAIREGRMTKGVQAALNARFNRDFEPPEDEFWLTLATTNSIVSSRNRRALERLEGQQFVARADINGEIDKSARATEETLYFKIGSQIMLLNNDSAGRWVNGSLGVIVDVDLDSDWEPDGAPDWAPDWDPDWDSGLDAGVDVGAGTGAGSGGCVYVRLRSGEIVAVEPYTWEVTRPEVVGRDLEHHLVGSFTQFPFKLAWAITIHKSQGQTLERAVIDLSGGTRATGQLYVALSRCTSLEGLVLQRRIYAKDLKIDHRVKAFLGSSTRRAADKFCAVEAVMVGQADGFVRPIEIAVAFPDGSVTSTLVNPTRDLGDAAAVYGLSASQMQVAPTLAEAWPFLEDAISGYGLVSSDGGEMLRILDTELKRNGLVSGLENVSAPNNGLAAFPAGMRAGERAQQTLAAALQDGLRTPAVAYQPLEESHTGYQLNASRVIVPFGEPAEVATMLERKFASQPVCAETEAALAVFEQSYGVRVPRVRAAEAPPAAEVLPPGTRVCFTGTVLVDGVVYEREEMEEIARAAGFHPVSNVSKTRCDCLVAADLATMSNKAKNAVRWGKPVISAEDFLRHVADLA